MPPRRRLLAKCGTPFLTECIELFRIFDFPVTVTGYGSRRDVDALFVASRLANGMD